LLRAGNIAGTVRPGALTASGAADANTLLVAAGHDHPMASSAIRRMRADARVDSLGTANATYGEAHAPPPSITEAGVDLSVPAAGNPGVACIGPIEFAAALHQAVADDAVIRDLLSAPSIAGSPSAEPSKAAHAGVVARFRAALEETACRAKQHFAAMTLAGVPVAPIYATGGWARSRALVELRASMFGQPITVIDEPELTATGAALFAAEAMHGAAPDFARHHRLMTVDPRRDWQSVYEGCAS
jgi:xylulokinase